MSKFVYEAGNLWIVMSESVEYDPAALLLDRAKDSADIVEEAYWHLTGRSVVPEAGTYLGRARVTIELLDDMPEERAAKAEFTPMEYGHWGKPLPVGVMEDAD